MPQNESQSLPNFCATHEMEAWEAPVRFVIQCKSRLSLKYVAAIFVIMAVSGCTDPQPPGGSIEAPASSEQFSEKVMNQKFRFDIRDLAWAKAKASILKKRSEITQPVVEEFLDYVISLKFHRFVEYQGEVWLEFDGGHRGFALLCNSETDSNDSCSSPTYREFMKLFSGCRAAGLDDAAFFGSPPLLKLKDFSTSESEWSNANVLFRALNGDKFLIDADGRTAWWCFPGGSLFPTNGMDEFIRFFIECNKSGNPCDSYIWRESRSLG